MYMRETQPLAGAGTRDAGETSTMALDAIRAAMAKADAATCCELATAGHDAETDQGVRAIAVEILSTTTKRDMRDIMAAEEDLANRMVAGLATGGYDPSEPDIEGFVTRANENRWYDTLYGCCGMIGSDKAHAPSDRESRAKMTVARMIGALEVGFAQAYHHAALRHKGGHVPRHMATA